MFVVMDGECVGFAENTEMSEFIFERREKGIAVDGAFDDGEVEIVDVREGLFVDFSATKNPNFFVGWVGQERLNRREVFGLRMLERGSAEDNVGPIGERTAHGFKGFPAHGNDLVLGALFDPFEVLGNSPRNGAIVADDTVFGHGSDRFEGPIHTAIGALMAGWGS